MSDLNAPYREKIDRCQNCGEDKYAEIIVANDNTPGCALCIKECSYCFEMIDTIERDLIPAKISQFGNDGVDSEICQRCAEKAIQYPEDFPDVVIRPVDILNVEIYRLKR